MKFYAVVRLTKDPQTFTNGCRIDAAERKPFSKEKESDFFQAKAFNKTADIICQFCHVGDQVFIEGHVTNNNYEKEGKTIYSNDFMIDNVQLLSNKREEKKEETKTVERSTDKYIEEEDLPF